MIFYLSAMTLAFLTTLVTIPMLTKFATKIDLLDRPNFRKHHQGAIPLTGGIAIFAGTMIAGISFLPLDTSSMIFLSCCTLLATSGIADDLSSLSAKARLWIQIGVGLLMLTGSGIYISDFGNLTGLGNIKLGWLGYGLTIIAVIGAINAFNMLDGIDGLLGINALISLGALFTLTTPHPTNTNILIIVILSATLLPYLLANFKLPPFKNKIFMGDSGSMLVGFAIAWLLIDGSQTTQNTPASFRPVTALWIIAVPLIDMTSIMIRRVIQGQSPLTADRNHIHHILIRKGLTPYQVLILISAMAITASAIGIAGEWLSIPEPIMFVGFITIFAIYQYTLRNTSAVSGTTESIN